MDKELYEWMLLVHQRNMEILGMSASSTEDMLKQLIKALEAGSYNADPSSLYPNTPEKKVEDAMFAAYGEGPAKKGCSHEWVEYVGLSECYSYCKHCDQKAVSDKK